MDVHEHIIPEMAVRGAELSGIRALHCLEYVEQQADKNLKRRKELLVKDPVPLDSRLSACNISDRTDDNDNDNDDDNEIRISHNNFHTKEKPKQKIKQIIKMNRNGTTNKSDIIEYNQIKSSENSSKIKENQSDNQLLNSYVINDLHLPWEDDEDIITSSDVAYLLAKNSINIL